jgi:hypothetical protein
MYRDGPCQASLTARAESEEGYMPSCESHNVVRPPMFESRSLDRQDVKVPRN